MLAGVAMALMNQPSSSLENVVVVVAVVVAVPDVGRERVGGGILQSPCYYHKLSVLMSTCPEYSTPVLLACTVVVVVPGVVRLNVHRRVLAANTDSLASCPQCGE